MGIGRFFRDVVCAPYSIPIGIINKNVKTLSMCSESTTVNLDLDEEENKSGIHKHKIGTQKQDIISSSQLNILNQTIQTILMDTHNLSTIQVSGKLSANVKSWTEDEDGKITMVLSEEEDPLHEYTTYIQGYKTEKMGDDGNIYAVFEFGCYPTAQQIQNIQTYQISSITNNIFEQIYNEIQASIENTTIETGSDIPSSTFTSILSENTTKSLLRQKIDSMIVNLSDQRVNASLNLDYIDRYGRCIYNFNDNNQLILAENRCRLKENSDNLPKYIYGICLGESNILKQTLNVEIISKNIIDISIGTIMENINDIDSKTEVTINRITNHRVIVVSLLFNVILIYLLFKFFGMFLRSIN